MSKLKFQKIWPKIGAKLFIKICKNFNKKMDHERIGEKLGENWMFKKLAKNLWKIGGKRRNIVQKVTIKNVDLKIVPKIDPKIVQKLKCWKKFTQNLYKNCPTNK